MRVCAHDRNTEFLACQHVGGADTSGDHSCSGTVCTGIGALSPAQTEFHNAVAVRGPAYTGSLGGDQ